MVDAFCLWGYENSLLCRLQGPMNTFGRFDSTEGKRAVPSSSQTALCKGIETVALTDWPFTCDEFLVGSLSPIIRRERTRCDKIRL